ncbi:MAG: ABC transporter ATP-binding protein [Solirubrobacterales bacterium]
MTAAGSVAMVGNGSGPASVVRRESVLAVASISKRYGHVQAVGEVSFDVRPGEIVGVLGPNGAGKTTTLSMICGLVRPDAGTIAVAGADVAADPAVARRQLGYAAQGLSIYPILTTRENVVFFGRLCGLSRTEAQKRTAELIEMFDLGECRDRPAGELSGGQQRRVHIACALVARPRLVLLDEPTVGMDVLGRARALETIAAIAAEGIGVCLSSHYLREVEDCCDRVVILDRGQVIAVGTPQALIAAHGKSYVQLRLAGGATSTQPVDDVASELPAMIEAAQGKGEVVGIDIVRPSLDAVFIALCGRRMEKPGGAA